MNRRHFLKILSASSVSLTGCQYLPRQGLFNPCHKSSLPKHLREHELVQATWDGIDTGQLWDCHTHLIGTGDSSWGVWLNPNMQTFANPVLYTKFKFYLNGSCAEPDENGTFDETYIHRLRHLHDELPSGFRMLLLAFDYHYDKNGKVNKEKSPFYTPNYYAQHLAKKYSKQFEWIASVHPYRVDAVAALEDAVINGARAVKWLPGAMGIDPASKLCDPFYQALVKFDIPLLTHSGAEHAVDVPDGEKYENPLLFRRALEHGVKVIFAHCATLGESLDTDSRSKGRMLPNLELFARLMSESRYESQVFGDISAVTQVNRDREVIAKLVTRDDWHGRLIYGSDYPLPGVMPVFSPENYLDWGYLSEKDAGIISQVRQYNPLLFDIMLKRHIKIDGKHFSPRIFESRRFFVS